MSDSGSHEQQHTFTNSTSLLKLISTESVMPSNHLVLCCPFSSLNLSQHQGLFQRVGFGIRPKYWSFSFSIGPSNEYSGLISFRIEWFYFLSVQRTLKSLLQHHSSKALILQCSAFFMVQLTSIHDYWKNHSFN